MDDDEEPPLPPGYVNVNSFRLFTPDGEKQLMYIESLRQYTKDELHMIRGAVEIILQKLEEQSGCDMEDQRARPN